MSRFTFETLVLVIVSMGTACRASQHGNEAATKVSAEGSRPAQQILLLRTEFSHAALFPEELESLRHEALVFLQKQRDSGPFSVVPLEELDRLERLSAASYARAGGPKCAAPPSFESLVQGQYGHMPRARLFATCATTPCKVALSIQKPPAVTGSFEKIAKWEALVEPPESIEGFRSAVRRLLIPPPEASGPGGLLGMVSADLPLVRVEGVHAARGWVEAPKPESLAAAQPALSACHEPGWSSSQTDRAVLSIATDGKVARCVLDPGNAPARPERLACLCGALQGVAFSPGQGERRLVVDLMNTPQSTARRGANVVGARFDHVVAADGSEFRSALGRRSVSLAACYAATPDADRKGFVRLPVRIAVDPSGRVTAVSLTGLPPEHATLAACLEQALHTMPLPCTKTATPTTLDAALVLYSHPEIPVEAPP